MVEAGDDAERWWRRSAECADRADGAGAEMMRRAVAAEFPPPGGRVRVDPATFALVVDGFGYLSHQDFSVQVVAGDGAAAALAAAAARFMAVGADGAEYRTDEERWAAEAADSEGRFYTPNFVSPVQPHPDGPWLWLDCKDATMPLMARTMLRILVQELHRAGVGDALVRPAPPVEQRPGWTGPPDDPGVNSSGPARIGARPPEGRCRCARVGRRCRCVTGGVAPAGGGRAAW
jgi:hypothetical protein